jgi:nitrite reductase/ring-hydroxylating ferredoxin subunit
MSADDHDVRMALRRGAGADHSAPDLAAIDRRRGRLIWRRRVAGGIAALLVLPLLGVAAAGLVAERRVDLVGAPGGLHEGSTTFALPEPGEAETGWLPDHTPVFVVHDRGGQVHVVRALTAYMEGGIDLAVAWCEPAQAFYSVFHVSEFLADGRYLGGPAATDLWTYEVRVADGQVHVGDPIEPRGRSRHDERPPGAPGRCVGAEEVDYDVVTVHDWPVHRSRIHTPEEAVTLPAGTWTFVEGYLVSGPGHQPRVCSETVGEEPPKCPQSAPSAAPDSQPATHTSVERGLMRAQVDDITGFRRLELLTLEVTDAYDPDSTRQEEDARSRLGDPTRVTVEDTTITVPAVDIDFGQILSPVPAGTYQLILENHGYIEHTLVSDELDVALHASAADQAATTVTLASGEHVFYCRIPGHREGGMELLLPVE